MRHYSKEELEMYRDRELGTWNQMVCKAHLKKCTECRSLLQNLELDDLFLKDVKNSVSLFNDIVKEVGKKK